MQLRFELEGGNFSKAGYASSQVKKILKQLSIDPRIIKRVVVALYEAEVNVVAHAGRVLDRFACCAGNGVRCGNGIAQYEKECRRT